MAITATILPTDTGDIFINKSGEMTVLDGPEAVLANIKQRMTFHKGAHYGNRDYGIPYFDQLLGANFNQSKQLVAEAELRRVILETPGVDSFVDEPKFEYDRQDRQLKMTNGCVYIQCEQGLKQYSLVEDYQDGI